MNSSPPRRLGSIDALRGITVAAMLLVNNPGDWSAVFAPLRHSEWHGCTPTDLVFPFFLFLVGVSMAFSVAPRALDVALRPALARGVLERALRILVAGALLHLLIWWALDTHHFRIWGVLQRIAVCAALVGVLAVYARPRAQAAVLVSLLVGYTVLLLGVGDLAPWTNPASRLDTTLFAPWIYQWHADHAWYTLRDRLAQRIDGFTHHAHVIADQRRQHRGGTEAAVRLRDGPQRRHVRRVVEQRAAATIDLHIDEAGQQPATAQINLLGGLAQLRRCIGQQRADAAVLDHHRQIIAEFVAGKDAGIAQDRCHHTVSVTLFRCGGRSGLKPRRSASALMAR